MCPSHHWSHTCQHFRGSLFFKKLTACPEFKVLHSRPFLPHLFPSPSLGKPWALDTQAGSYQTHCGTLRLYPQPLCLEGLLRLSVCQLLHFKAVISKLKCFK